MKAALYSRKSRFTGKGESIENQIHLCKEHGMKYLGVNENDFFVYEDEGFSGGNTNRPEFQRMMKDAKAKKFDVIICYRLDRISRNVHDFSNLIKDLKNNNVDFVSIREQFDTTTPMGRAMMYIASVFSQLERETIAERIKDNMVQLAKTGRWLGGVPPTGFESKPVVTMDKSGKQRTMFKLSPLYDELATIKLIFDKFVNFKSITKVERYLVTNKIRTKNGLDFQRYSIRFILANPVYAIADKTMYDYLIENKFDVYADWSEFNGLYGIMGYNKTLQDKELSSNRFRATSEWIISIGKHEGIISSEDWIKTQKLLEQNKSKSYRKIKSTQSLLSGVLRCAKCGSYMRPKTMQRKTETGEQVFYYMCEMKEKSRRTRCNIKNINGNVIDSSILNEIKKIAVEYSPLLDNISEKESLVETTKGSVQSEIDEIRKQISVIEKGIENLVTIITKGLTDEIRDVMIKRMEELVKEKEIYKTKLLELTAVNKNIELNEFNLELVSERLCSLDDSVWELMDVANKRRMIKSAIDKILWDGEKLSLMLFGSKNII